MKGSITVSIWRMCVTKLFLHFVTCKDSTKRLGKDKNDDDNNNSNNNNKNKI